MQFGERIQRAKPEPIVKLEDETARHLYRCLYDNDIDGFREIWSHVHLDVDQPLRTFQWTPLMIACQCRHLEFVRYLLIDLHANANASSNDMSVLILTCLGPYDLFGTTNGISAIDEANVKQICELLLDHGDAMVDKANLRRETALMHAAANGFVTVIKCLLDRKATLEACDVDDRTAIFFAVQGNHFDAVRVLIEAGALTETENRFGSTAKLLAQQMGFDNLLELFPPDPIVEFVPNQFTSYETPYDLIPTAFPDKKT